MTSAGLFNSPTAALQRTTSSTINDVFKVINGFRIPAPLGNHQQQIQQSTGQPDCFADRSDFFYSPTAELLRGSVVTSCRLLNGYRVPKKISRRNTTPLSFTEEGTLFHSTAAIMVADGAAMDAAAKGINNLRHPLHLNDNQRQSTDGCHEFFSSTISKPQSQSQSWLSADEPIISSPTAVFLRAPQNISHLRTYNGLRIPHSISHRRHMTGFNTRSYSAEPRIRDTKAPSFLQELSLNVTDRAIDYHRHHNYQVERAAHILHTNSDSGEEDGVRAETRQVQLCALVDLAIDRLHDPFTDEDRQILRHILSYLDQRRYDLVARRISVDSNAPQVTVPVTWIEVADLAFQAIRTVDYPYLLRVMQAIDILASGIWYTESEE
ncbi:hypothetical protein CI238_02216 [Colletotrichum incanum]|uniref:Uncharacterized protein n=1 Tax=Colletotrichum incanum TaxID=1573173 RepID=A0A162PDR7_COLIC|nr:hypothetical protein CI238_02216 [Colletotrichum incanum]OHW89461.1 hypothetical protein CSPAE12_11955 [Colletotrichum incanum]